MAKSGTKIHVPRTFAEVTPEWLSQALAASCPGIAVESATVDKTMGFKPNKARVHLTYNDAGKRANMPATLVIKGSFNGYEPREPIIEFANIAEVISYRDIVPRMTINTPKVYHLGVDTEPNESVVLLFEDMAYRNPSYFHGGKTLNYGEATRFLDAIARYQAPTWNSPEFKAGGAWGPGTPADTNHKRIHNEYFEYLPHSDHWEKSAQSPRGAAVPRILRDPKRMAAGWARLMEVLSIHGRVMVHGDEHLGNLFMEPDGTPGFVDMLSRGEPWPMHYAIFLIATIDSLDRRAWERPLLAHFLNRLAAYGAPAPTFDEAWYAYRCSTIASFLIWFNNSGAWQPEMINTGCAARAGLAVLDHDAFALLGV